MSRASKFSTYYNTYKLPGGVGPYYIKQVIFNPPATICFWNDGTKTVTKCSKTDIYSKEAGLSICVLKKLMGSSANELLRTYTSFEKNVVTLSDVRHLINNK